MKILERVLIAIALIGLILKAATINQLGDTILTAGLMFLSLFYFLLGFAALNGVPFGQVFKSEGYTTVSKSRIFGAIGLGIFFSMILTGIIFKMLHLAGANQCLLLGGLGVVLILVIALIRFMVKGRTMDTFYGSIFIKGTLLVILVVGAVFIKSTTLVAFFHRNDPKYIELYNKMIADPQNEQAWEEFVEYSK